MIEVGDKAPEFTLFNQDDKLVSLNKYDGKWLVLYFYPKDDTPGCTIEACDFTDGLADFSALDATVIGISGDSTQSHREFIAKYNLSIPLLSDPDRPVHKAYGAWGVKEKDGKEYEGTIRSTFIVSPNGSIAAKWHNVNVRAKHGDSEVKHADLVREKLAELQ